MTDSALKVDTVLTATPQEQSATPTGTLDKYVGAGGKYSSTEELAKGYDNANTFIGTLQEELAEAKGQLNERKNKDMIAEGVRAELQAQQDSQSPAPD